MQLDMFGATNETTTQDAAPPTLSSDGLWLPPESLALNAALISGSLPDAIAILNRLKDSALSKALLGSGFQLISGNRAAVIKHIQGDIVAAARLKLTGRQLFEYRAKTGAEASQDQQANQARAALPIRDIRIGDLLRQDGGNYTVTGAIKGGVSAEGEVANLGDGVTTYRTVLLQGDDVIRAKLAYEEWEQQAQAERTGSGTSTVAENGTQTLQPEEPAQRVTLDMVGQMKPGMRVVDTSGEEYEAFSTRFAYLQVFPVGADGKAQVFAGNSIFFHLDPATADAHPSRRHDPLYLLQPLELAKPELLQDNTLNNSQLPIDSEQGKENASVDQSRSLRPGSGTGDRNHGVDLGGGSEPVAVGLAGSGGPSTQGGNLSDSAGSASQSGEGRAGGSSGTAAPGAARDSETARDPGSTADHGLTAGTQQRAASVAGRDTQEPVRGLASQLGMFDAELIAEHAAIAAREEGRNQARRERLMRVREQLEADTSAWDQTEFAPRILSLLGALRSAGSAADEMRQVIQAGITQDSKNNRLTEEGVAFRETVARRELAKLAKQGTQLRATWDPVTPQSLAQDEPDVAKLPSTIVEAAASKMNELGEQLASLGFASQYEVEPGAPAEARDIANQMRETYNAMLMLAPIRERVAKGHKNAKPEKLERIEDFATQAIGIDTRQYPGINGASKAEPITSLDQPAINLQENDKKTEPVVLPSAIATALRADMEAQKRLVKSAQAAEKKEPSAMLSRRVFLQGNTSLREQSLRRMRLSVFDAEDAVLAAIATAGEEPFAQYAGLFPRAQRALQRHLEQLTQGPHQSLASTKAVEESQQEKSEREFGENYNRVANTDNLASISTLDLERAESWASRESAREKRKGWDGGQSNEHLTRALDSEITRIAAALKERRVASQETVAPRFDDQVITASVTGKDYANERLSAKELEGKIAQFEVMRDEALKELQTGTLSPTSRSNLNDKVAARQKIIDDAQAALDSRRHTKAQPATVRGALDAFDADNSEEAMAIMAKLNTAMLRSVGESIGFRLQNHETGEAYMRRLAPVASQLTKTARAQTARDNKMYERLMQLATDYDRVVSSRDRATANGAAGDIPAHEANYLKVLTDALQQATSEESYARVVGFAQSKRPAIFATLASTVDAPGAELPDERKAFEHEGIKIYPVDTKEGPRWAVQTEANRTSGKVLGDTLHATNEQAIAEATRQSARVLSQVQRITEQQSKVEATKAKKEHLNQVLGEFVDRADYSPMMKERARLALDKPVRYENNVMPAYAFVQALLAKGLQPRTTQEDRIQPMSRLAFFRANNEQQRAHEERIRQGGKKTVHHIGNFEVGSFEHAYASFLASKVAEVGPPQTPTPEADLQIERYQWMRNAEGGQSFGNQQVIQPMTKDIFDEYVAPLVIAEVRTFEAYVKRYPQVTHVNLLTKAGEDKPSLGRPSSGPLEDLRPSPAAFAKGWVMQVESFDEERAIAHGKTADSAVLASVVAPPVAAAEGDAPSTNAAVADEFFLSDEDRIGLGSAGEKFKDNLRAINILRTLTKEGRHAVGEERNALARYVGWGGLKGVFDAQNPRWTRQHTALRAVLNDAEWAAASRSQLDAFFTQPVVVKAMYSAAQQLGFPHGRTLDPSIGVGNFLGLMPPAMRERSNLHGVELDILSSQIVAALYPKAHIAKATGFENYKMPGGYFDMVIGNPPFGSHTLFDEKGSVYSGWSIHNYFFAKSIELLRPGGIMPMVVTHNFLDKLDPHVRRWIARRAELVSGVRLPDNAFKENANTEVVTDILLFRRLDDTQILGKQETPDWLETTDTLVENPETGESHTVAINNYFLKNPQNVLGTNVASGSMYRGNEYSVTSNGDLETQLAAWVQGLPTGLYTPLERSPEELSVAAVAVPESVKEGSFFVQGNEVWQRISDEAGQQRATKWTAPNMRAGERMQGMIELRERLRAQMRMERTHSVMDTQQIEEGRAGLNRAYDTFQRKFGFVNDSTNRRIFLDDTESALVEALEFDYEKPVTAAKALEHGIEERPSKAKKADIFSRRVLFPPGEIQIVESAKDALLHSLNYTGGIDLPFMQQAYPKGEAEIVAELDGLIYEDPVQGYVTADAYLSGDVKTKLREVSKAAERDPSLMRNVEALKAVIPKDKLPSEIHAAIGAAWIPVKVFSDFAKEISGGVSHFTYVAATAQWLDQDLGGADREKSRNEFGTEKMSSLNILVHLMNSRAPEIKKRVLIDGEERYVTDEPQTVLVRAKASSIRAHWDSWLWTDGDRADQLATIYNDRFNRTVDRKYDGSHMTFPGINSDIELLAHQKNGAWRGLQSRRMLLDQVVGAGKTFEMVAMTMEMRRLGITKKPLFAVPNHLTLQWRSEFHRLYPAANILAATPQDFEKDHRERFFSKVVTGNWDAVIIGHSSLKKIPLPIEAETKIIREQLEEISDAIEDLKRGRGDKNVVRDMEKIKITLQAKVDKLQKKAGSKDKVVDFSDLGVDALFIDEHHEFKNLFFSTQMNRVAGLGNPAGSGKAFDLFIKFRWLEETFGSSAPLITATGTPISNSLAEMFTMQRYMQYDELKSQNLHLFDAWAKQYGDVQNVYEVAPSGTGYRLSQRFAHFKNLGSLMGQYNSFSDIITLDDLKAQEAARGKVFPIPKLLGDRPTNIVAKRSELQEAFFGIPEIVRDDEGRMVFEIDLSNPTTIEPTSDGKFHIRQDTQDDEGELVIRHLPRRFESLEDAQEALVIGAMTPKMTVDPKSIVGQFENLRELTRSTKGKINALSLTSLANKAGLDYRIIDANAPDFPGSKINEAVRRIVDIGRQWEADKGTQLIFCDLSVPLSAKARMASKEKRLYVRDDEGFIVQKRGTLHSLKDYEGLPYYLVPVGKGKEKTFSIYDPISGALMKEGCDTKQDAHAFVSGIITSEGGQERWLDEREKRPPMGADEIDEYKNEHALDADGDAADLEISLTDVEGASGVGGFSVYDDMKAKLIAHGIPEGQIAFIHDYDTPQAKQELFRRINAGEVRYTFGSTPKMGAGTNVQERVVAEHHIDAPWRPSDLEQREGRVIRRGNKLYERDPEGFRVFIGRYATSQTYDTRRWQILQHKAAGLEQLRKYAGANEMEDVASEAANSADMKAAASGNPLILRETQLANEVKVLKLLERAHSDGQYSGRRRLEWCQSYTSKDGPKEIARWRLMQLDRDASNVLGRYRGKDLVDKDALMVAIDDISAKTSVFAASFELTYRGLPFNLSKETIESNFKTFKTPDGSSCLLDQFSRTGVVTRMENWVNKIDEHISDVQKWMANAKQESIELKGRLGLPFPQAETLKTTIEEHGKVQRALIKSNALSAVKPADAKEFEQAIGMQKGRLVELGFQDALAAFEQQDAELNALTEQPQAPGAEVPTEVEMPVASLATAVPNMEACMKVAANSVQELRKVDVYRVLVESNRSEHRSAIAAYIRQERPDLQSEVDEILREEEAAVAPPAQSALAASREPSMEIAQASASLCGLSGAQIQAMQGGKLNGADQFPGLTFSKEQITALQSAVKAERDQEQARVAAEVARDPRIGLLKDAGVNGAHLLQAAKEAQAGDDSLIKDLARIQGIALDASTSLASVAPTQTSALDLVKTRMVDSLSVEFPDGWIVMNAPRPLLGTKTVEGEFECGRFYAAIDPTDPMADAYLFENVKLDARLLVAVSRETQMEVALHGHFYRDKYLEREPDDRYRLLNSTLAKFRDMPYGELKTAICNAKGVVQEGVFSGPVVEVAHGVLTQRINRSGTTVCHDASKLTEAATVGSHIDIHYHQGRGRVSSAPQLSAGLGR